jgi:fructokinase
MITVIGDALIKLVLAGGSTSGSGSLRALPGGSALLTAVRTARLGYPTALMARLSADDFGQCLRSFAARNGVDVSVAPEADEPTMITVSGPLHEEDSLYFQGTAIWQWSAEELRHVPAETSVLYLGSLAGCLPPNSTRMLRAAARQRSRGAAVCVDLRTRPEVVGSPGRGRLLLDRLIRPADVVMTSIEDLAWLHPGRAPDAVAQQWLELGPSLAVITCGPDGVMAVHRTGSVVHRPAGPAGADDAFTAGLLGGLHQLAQFSQDLGELTPGEVTTLIDNAIKAENGETLTAC